MGSPFWVKARRRRPVWFLGVVNVAIDARGVVWGSMRLVLLSNKSEREILRGSNLCPVSHAAAIGDVSSSLPKHKGGKNSEKQTPPSRLEKGGCFRAWLSACASVVRRCGRVFCRAFVVHPSGGDFPCQV